MISISGTPWRGLLHLKIPALEARLVVKVPQCERVGVCGVFLPPFASNLCEEVHGSHLAHTDNGVSDFKECLARPASPFTLR